MCHCVEAYGLEDARSSNEATGWVKCQIDVPMPWCWLSLCWTEASQFLAFQALQKDSKIQRFVMRWCDHALNISVWWGGAPAKTECARIQGSRLSQRTRLVLSMTLKTILFLRYGMCAFSACVGVEKTTLPKYKANRAFQGHKGWNDMKTHESETWNVVTWCDLLWDLRSSRRTACTTCQGSEHGGNLSWKETEKATSQHHNIIKPDQAVERYLDRLGRCVSMYFRISMLRAAMGAEW